MDAEIRLTPRLDDTDLRKFQEWIRRLHQDVHSLAVETAKVRIPGMSGPGSGGAPSSGGGAAGSGGGGPGGPHVPGTGGGGRYQPQQILAPVTGQQSGRRRSGASTPSFGLSSGQFLTTYQDVILPILPELEQLNKVGGQAAVGRRLTAHHAALQATLNAPMGSYAWHQAVGAYAAQAGIDRATAERHAQRLWEAELQRGQATQVQDLRRAYQQMGSTGSGAGRLRRSLSHGPQALLESLGLGSVLRLGAWALPVAGAAWGVGQVKQGWSTYLQQGTAFSALSKSVGDANQSFNQLRDTINKTGLSFAETLPQITQAFQTLVPYVGNLGTRGLSRMMTAAQGFAFSYGLNPTGTTQAFGQAAQIGLLPTNSTVGQMTPAQFAGLIANMTSAGQMQGRQQQVLAELLTVSQHLAQTTGMTPNATVLANIMTQLNRSGNPLLQGTQAASLINSINQGIQSPGLGAAGQLFTYRALNGHNRLSYWQEQLLQSQGLTGVNPLTGISNFAALMHGWEQLLPHGVQSQRTKYGTLYSPQSDFVASMMAHTWGIPTTQALDLLKLYQGQPLSPNAPANKTFRLAQQLGGPNGLQTLLQKGGMNVFSAIANATSVKQLQNAATQVTHNLHGHVSAQFDKVLHQYQQLGHAPQTAAVAHQRAQDFRRMQEILGQSVLKGPHLQTSMDKLVSTQQKANALLSQISSKLTPIAQYYEQFRVGTAHTLHRVISGQGLSHANITGPLGAGTIGYTLPAGGMATSLSARLASFVTTNVMTAALTGWMQGQPGSSASPTVRAATWGTTSGGGGSSAASRAQQQAFLRKMIPYAQKDAAWTGLPADFFLTQWADESTWGTSLAARQNHNLAGIKPWAGAAPGRDSQYAGYGSLGAFAHGVAQFYLQNPRYGALLQAARQGDSTAQLLQLLGQSGYATNPDYGPQLLQVLSEIRDLLRNGNTPTAIPWHGMA